MFDVCHLQSQGTSSMARLVSCPSTITTFVLWLLVLLLSSPGFKVGSTPPLALLRPCSKPGGPEEEEEEEDSLPQAGVSSNLTLASLHRTAPEATVAREGSAFFLISIKVQRVLLEEGSQEIMPFQVHSWLLCWGLCMYYVFFIFLCGGGTCL